MVHLVEVNVVGFQTAQDEGLDDFLERFGAVGIDGKRGVEPGRRMRRIARHHRPDVKLLTRKIDCTHPAELPSACL